ncbi:MAG TPA: hypothetical protein VMX54_01110 [Vicinamibacteria bacterium]|nr:hypothetical protein [Vicinamibacteria bacterium]
MPRLSTALACASWLLVTACNATSTLPTTTTAATTTATVTDTFTGTLAQGTSASSTFTVGTAGTVTITLVSLSPQTTITMGVGIGTPSASVCVVNAAQDDVKVGASIQASLNPGTYCVLLYDLGNMSGPDAYSLTVVHP